MAGYGSPPAENRAWHPNRQVSISQAYTLNPGPLVGTEARAIPNQYEVRRASSFGSGDHYMGWIRQSETYGGRWVGILPGQTPDHDVTQTPAFNVRTEGRARTVATALAGMSSSEAASRSRGFRESYERRWERQRYGLVRGS